MPQDICRGTKIFLTCRSEELGYTPVFLEVKMTLYIELCGIYVDKFSIIKYW